MKAEDAVAAANAGQLKITEIPFDFFPQIWIKFNLRRISDFNVRKALAILFRDWTALDANRDISGTFEPLSSGTLFESPYSPNPFEFTDEDRSLVEPLFFLNPELWFKDRGFIEVPSAEVLPAFITSRGERRKAIREVIELLQASGYRLGDGVFFTPEAKPFEIKVIESTGATSFFEFFRGNFQAVGIKLIIERLDPATYINTLEEGDFDVIKSNNYATIVPFTSSYKALYHSSSEFRDNLGIADPSVDLLIEKMISVEEDMSLQKSYIKALENLAIGKFYFVPLASQDANWVVHQADLAPLNRVDGKVAVPTSKHWIKKD